MHLSAGVGIEKQVALRLFIGLHLGFGVGRRSGKILYAGDDALHVGVERGIVGVECDTSFEPLHTVRKLVPNEVLEALPKDSQRVLLPRSAKGAHDTRASSGKAFVNCSRPT